MWLKHSISFLLLIFWFELIFANYLPTRRRKPVRVTNEDRFPSPRIVILGMYTVLQKSLPDHFVRNKTYHNSKTCREGTGHFYFVDLKQKIIGT